MTRSAKPIRVVHIARDFGLRFSGITHRLYSLLSGWRDEDVALDLWGTCVRPLNIGSGNPDYALAARLWPPGVKRSGILAKLKWAVRQYAFLVKHARSYDVAHFYDLTSGTLLCPLLLHLLGKKAVFTSSLQGSDNPIAVRESRWGRPAARLLRSFDGILAVSPQLAEEYRASGFKSVACIPNFLAVPQLDGESATAARVDVRGRLSIPLDAPVLLFVGVVDRRKGIDLLAECFTRLAVRHHSLWLIAVGPPGYDHEFVRSVRERIDRAGVATRVVWTGMLRDKSVVAQHYSAADIFVFPTRAEGMPNVLIEATAAGLPTVATCLPGVTDYAVKDRETGLLFPPDDVDAMARAIEQLISDPTLRAKMGQAARAHSKRFGFEEYCRQLKAFYLLVAGATQ